MTASMTVASVLHAQTVSEQDKALAMQKFDMGSKAFDQKRFKDAIDLFLAADSIVKNPAFAYNASLAYDAMGDTAAALRWAREYLRRAPSAADQAAVRDHIAKFEAHLRESGLRQLTVISTPPGATVLVDHRPVGVTPWTGELIPGSHTLELRLRGFGDRSTSAELNGDGSVEVALDLAKESDAKPSASSIAPVKTAPTWLLPTSLGILGAGAVGAGIAVGLEVARAGAENRARDAKDQIDAADQYTRMQHLQLGARVAAGVAGGLGAIGGAMLIVDLATANGSAKSANTQAVTTTTTSLLLGPSSGALRIRF
jgi:hypothetical protein